MQNTCPKCNTSITPEDNFCRHCGRSLRPGTGFWFTHGGVILLAFVLGPFALIPLWMSKLIGQTAKIIYTVVLVLLSIYMAFVCWQVFVLLKDLMDYSMQGMFIPADVLTYQPPL